MTLYNGTVFLGEVKWRVMGLEGQQQRLDKELHAVYNPVGMSAEYPVIRVYLLAEKLNELRIALRLPISKTPHS